jgi:hypothetical protein
MSVDAIGDPIIDPSSDENFGDLVFGVRILPAMDDHYRHPMAASYEVELLAHGGLRVRQEVR